MNNGPNLCIRCVQAQSCCWVEEGTFHSVMFHYRDLSTTVIHGPWHFVEATIHHRILHWIGIAPNPVDGSVGSGLVNDLDDTVDGIRVLDYFGEANGVKWEVVIPTSNRGRSLHEIVMEQGTSSDTCLLTWASEYQEDCSAAEIATLTRRKVLAFEEMRHIVASCLRMTLAQNN